MMLIGALLKKKDIIDENGKKCLADLCINVVIPCNIFKSCLIELDAGVLKSCAMLFVSAVIMQLLCLALNLSLFERYDPQRKKVLQYCTIVPMSGFLGNPIAEGINEVGVLYTSIFLIPMRIVMWSVGTTYFAAGATAAIFAAKYGSDAPFAAKNVVFTTLFSMLTLPLWAYFVG